MVQQQFIFGGNTGETYDSLQRKRRIAEAMLANRPRKITNVGEGINSAASSIAAALLGRHADRDEARMRGEAQDQYASIFSPMAGRSSTSGRSGPMSQFDAMARTGGPTRAAAALSDPEMASLFNTKEERFGLPQGYLTRTAQIESNFNPRAQNPNSSAGGLFQFIDATARQYGLEDRFDPVASTEAAARLAADNAEMLRRTLGREPSAAELYLAHQQGAGGAAQLLANPNVPAVSIVGRDAVRLNGGREDMTAGEFAGLWLNKFGGEQTMSAQQQPQYDMQQLIQAANDPRLDEGQRQYAAMLAQQQMQQMQPPDPREALEMERLQMQNEMMRREMNAPPEGPEPTDDIREYEFAVEQGYDGTFQDFMRDMRSAGATNVNVNTAEGPRPELIGTQGLVAVPDETVEGGYRIIRAPGSPAEREFQQEEEAQARATEMAAQTEQTRSSVVRDTAQQMREMLERRGPLDLPEVGVIGSRLSGVNQEAADMAGMLDTLRGMVVFDRLERLRQASATGASGLGQVTEREIALLGAQLGALDQSLSRDRILQTLDTVEQVFSKMSPQAEAYLTGQTDQMPTDQQPVQEESPPPGVSPEVWQRLTPENRQRFFQMMGQQ